MGKSSKKSTPKVDVAPAITAPTKSGKKGKREAEEALEKQVSVKKQKRDEAVEQAVQKQKSIAKTQTKKEDSSSTEDSSSSDSDSDQEVAVKAVVPSKKQPITKTGNGTVGAPAKKGKQASSESSDSTESDSDEDNVPKSKVIATLKNLPAAVSKKKKESSESSDSDSSSDEETVKSEQLKKLTPAVKNGSVADDNLDSETSSDEDDKKTPAKTVSLAPKKKAESSDSSDGEDVESSESESDEDDDANAKTTKSAVPLKRPTEVKESKQPVVPSNVGKPSAKTAEKKGTSSEDSSDDSSDDETSKTQVVKKKPAQVQEESSSSEEEESEEEGSEEESEEDQRSKTSKKRDTDVDMVDAVSPKTNSREVMKSEKKAPKTPVTPQPQTTGTKTLFVGNLSFQVERDDVVNFFKDAGEVVDVRFSTNEEGRFKGFGHVEFATAEAANKALELNNEELLNRPVRLDLARERGSFTPHSGKESNSFQKGGRGQVQTIFVRGFDKSLGEDGARSALEEHFGSCGEISRISIPVDYETGSVKGIAYMDFNGGEGFNKALELNGSEFGENYLTVEEAKPRGDNRDGAGSGRGGGGRGRSGGRDSGGRFGGRRGGRGGSGGRFGGGGSGGRFGGGGRGRGTPNKPSMAAAGTGKKTTFDD